MEEVLFFSLGLHQLKNAFQLSMAQSATASDSFPPHLKCSSSQLCYLNDYAIITAKHVEDHTSLANSLPEHAYMPVPHTIISFQRNLVDFTQNQVQTKVHAKRQKQLLSLDCVRGATACLSTGQI